MLFDMGIALGEAIIANCPKLHWDVDPVSAILPRQARILKRTPGMSFQRPMLTGYENPVFRKIPLHDVYTFAAQMMRYMLTLDGRKRLGALRRDDRRLISDQFSNDYKAALTAYLADDADSLRAQIAPEDYLKLIDDLLADGHKNND